MEDWGSHEGEVRGNSQISMKKDLAKKDSLIFDVEALKKLPKGEIIKMLEDSLLPFNNPEKYQQLVRERMPEFAREIDSIEDKGTGILEASQQMMMVVFDCLRRYHGWNIEEIKRLEQETVDVLTGVAEFEDAGLSMQSLHSVSIVGDNVQELGIGGLVEKISHLRHQKARMNRTGLDIHKAIDEKPFTKKLK